MPTPYSNLTSDLTHKKPTNVSINATLLNQAKALKINLSATLEQALSEVIKQKQQALWFKENKQSIQNYNAFVEQKGLFSDDLRSF